MAEAEVETEPPAPAPPSRMGECQVCEENPGKYRCPRCGTVTCGLACSKAHKTRGEGCNGKRDRAAFKDIREFSDADVVSDYRCLEETLLEKDRAKRWRPQYADGSDAAARSERAPASRKVIALLTQQAKARGTTLLCMPDGMARRVANTTFYDRRRDVLQWRVEWLFHGISSASAVEIPDANDDADADAAADAVAAAAAAAAKAVDEKVDDTTTIAAALRRHFEQGPGRAARLHQLRRFTDALKAMDKGDGGGASVCVYFEKHGCPANAKRYHRLSLENTFKENLAGKNVLEFPTLHVAVLPADAGKFLEPEEET